MLTFYGHPRCTTCKKAKAWLTQHQQEFQEIDLTQQPPAAKDLLEWLDEGSRPLKRFFNTSGNRYRELGLKDTIDTLSKRKASELLASDGMLIKRPLLVADGQLLAIGFKEKEYEGAIN